MSGFKTTRVEQNEIAKESDFSFGFDSSVENSSLLYKLLLDREKDFVIGGRVIVNPENEMSIYIEALTAYSQESGLALGETQRIGPIQLESSDGISRIDLVQIKAAYENYDEQHRAFNDSASGGRKYLKIHTKKKVSVKVMIKKGNPGSVVSPLTGYEDKNNPENNKGWIKLAEIKIDSGVKKIEQIDIENITSDSFERENENWTNEKDRTYNLGLITELKSLMRKDHKEDGSHKCRVIKNSHIATGIGKEEFNSNFLPLGNDLDILDEKTESIKTVYEALLKITQTINNQHENIKQIENEINNIDTFLDKHDDDTQVHGATSKAIKERIILRDENGFAHVNTPEKNDTSDTIATTQYVKENILFKEIVGQITETQRGYYYLKTNVMKDVKNYIRMDLKIIGEGDCCVDLKIKIQIAQEGVIEKSECYAIGSNYEGHVYLFFQDEKLVIGLPIISDYQQVIGTGYFVNDEKIKNILTGETYVLEEESESQKLIEEKESFVMSPIKYVQLHETGSMLDANTAIKLQTARTISLEKNVTGSFVFDGSDDVVVNTMVTCVPITAIGLRACVNDICSTALGGGAKATGSCSIAIGAGAQALDVYAIALGRASCAYNNHSIAVGYGTSVCKDNAIAIGCNSKVDGEGSIALGTLSNVSKECSIGIGHGAQANNLHSTALGSYSIAGVGGTTAIGHAAKASGHISTALGHSANAGGSYSVAVGHNAIASGNGSIAIGAGAQALDVYAIALGRASCAYNNHSIAVGYGTSVCKDNAIAIGCNSKVDGEGSIALGTLSNVSKECSIAIGHGAQANNLHSTALGSYSIAGVGGTTAIGHAAKASGHISTALGHSAMANGEVSLAIGHLTKANGQFSVALGYGANASEDSAIAIGYGATVNKLHSTALGSGSIAGDGGATAIGHAAKASGQFSVAVGHNAIASGNGSIAIGLNAGKNNNQRNHIMYIGNAPGGDWGALSRIESAVGITVTSDVRFKHSIQKVNNSLCVLKRVEPIVYNWYPEKIRTSEDTFSVGLSAQSVEKSFKEAHENKEIDDAMMLAMEDIVIKDTSNTQNRAEYKLTTANLIPLLINGITDLNKNAEESNKIIKELNKNAEESKRNIEELKQEINDIKSKL